MLYSRNICCSEYVFFSTTSNFICSVKLFCTVKTILNIEFVENNNLLMQTHISENFITHTCIPCSTNLSTFWKTLPLIKCCWDEFWTDFVHCAPIIQLSINDKWDVQQFVCGEANMPSTQCLIFVHTMSLFFHPWHGVNSLVHCVICFSIALVSA